MKKLLTIAFVAIILSGCEKQNILPQEVSKCGTVTAKTQFKEKYLIFIDGAGFEFSLKEWESAKVGELKCF